MSNTDWLLFNGVELVNHARTAQLATLLGIDTVWIEPSSVDWIEEAQYALTDYGDVTTAPWYDPEYPASAEFAGIICLSLPGLSDSTSERETQQFITDGGSSGRARSSSLVLPANMVLAASTDRGAVYGKQWMDRVLKGSTDRTICTGSDLTYYAFKPPVGGDPHPPIMKRRDVVLTRAAQVTRKRMTDCSVTLMTTFTLTANDPFEYGEPMPQFAELGEVPFGPGVDEYGTLPTLEQSSCPVYDYTPIYDPLYPALIAPPTPPQFLPAGWNIEDGMIFDRFWVRTPPVEPSALSLVPVITLTTAVAARMIRISIWPSLTDAATQCDPLFSAVVTYLPAGMEFTIDGEPQASYAWDGASPVVRRADSLVYAPDATPVEWTSFNHPDGLLVALDVFYMEDGVTLQGEGTVRAALDLVSKSE